MNATPPRVQLRRSLPALWLVLLVAVAAGCTSSATSAEPFGTHRSEDFRGTVLDTPLAKRDFTLTDTSGQPYDFLQQTTGDITLLYFGYTHCPDVCPTHMAAISTALNNVIASVSDHVKVVFVTTDPDRDTPQVLRQWLNNFAISFVGLTGSADQIASVEQLFGVTPAVKEDLGNGNYAVGHAAYVIAFTPDNLAHLEYPSGILAADWAHDLTRLEMDGPPTS